MKLKTHRFLSFFVLISSSLILFTSVALYLSSAKRASPSDNKAASPRIVYADEKDQPKYSRGSCQKDEECVPAGCSGQLCSNDPGLITSCELRSDFPDKEKYACGCVETSCAWFEKGE